MMKCFDTETKRIIWRTYAQEIEWEERKQPGITNSTSKTLDILNTRYSADEAEYFVRSQFIRYTDFWARNGPSSFNSLTSKLSAGVYAAYRDNYATLLAEEVERIKDYLKRMRSIGSYLPPHPVAMWLSRNGQLDGAYIFAAAVRCIWFPGLIDSEVFAGVDVTKLKEHIATYKAHIYRPWH